MVVPALTFVIPGILRDVENDGRVLSIEEMQNFIGVANCRCEADDYDWDDCQYCNGSSGRSVRYSSGPTVLNCKVGSAEDNCNPADYECGLKIFHDKWEYWYDNETCSGSPDVDNEDDCTNYGGNGDPC